MGEHAADNRETEDRNLYPLPSNIDITKSANDAPGNVIKYLTMKNIILFLSTIMVTVQILAAEPNTTTTRPAAPDCSCGACD